MIPHALIRERLRSACRLLAVISLTTSGAVSHVAIAEQPCEMPGAIVSSSHTLCEWSTDASIELVVDGSSVASDPTGYSYVFDDSPATDVDETEEASVPTPTIVSHALGDGDAHYFHVRVHGGGGWSSTVHAGPFWIDASAPPAPLILSAPRRFLPSRSLSLAWRGTDATSGVAGYEIWVRVAPYQRGFGPPRLAFRGARGSARFTLPVGKTASLAVLAVDRAGNKSGFSSAFTVSVPLGVRSLSRAKGWSTQRRDSLFSGQAFVSKRPGATLSRTHVRFTRLAVLVTRCPTCGRADVYWGSRWLAQVDTRSSKVRRSQVVEVVAFPRPRVGTIRIVARTQEPVIIEGLGVAPLWGADGLPKPKIHARYPGKFRSGDRDRPMVALTFDDSGSPRSLGKILRILERENVEATFFLLGSWVNGNPSLIREISRGGHQLANHSFRHSDMRRSPGRLSPEIRSTSAAYRRAGVPESNVFRFPYGSDSRGLTQRVNSMGYAVAGWDVDPRGWSGRPPSAIVDEVRREARWGSIVLMHVHAGSDIKALPGVISVIREKGLRLVRLDEMFAG